MKMMFLDESGNHDLRRIDSNYPVFVLGGVIVERSYVREVVRTEIQEFKERQFGRSDVVLHTVDMHKGRGDYGFLADLGRRIEFFDDLNETLTRLEFKVVATVIRKSEHIRRYGELAPDPYHVGLKYLVERFCLELGQERDSGFICAERRNPGLDARLMEVWEELVQTGTEHVAALEIDSRIIGLELKDKRSNLAAMQLADLVITPIGRHVAGKPETAFQVRWSTIEPKLRRFDGRYLGPGLIIRPR